MSTETTKTRARHKCIIVKRSRCYSTNKTRHLTTPKDVDVEVKRTFY